LIAAMLAIRSSRLRAHWPLIAALGVSVLLRAALWIAQVVPFNSDEAVVALMARHILQGARPVFFYGQAYMGSLDAWLAAGAFALLGESVAAVRAVQAALYLGTLITTYALALKVSADLWAARVAVLLLALPSVLVMLYTTVTLGGYGETLLLGNSVLLIALKIGETESAHWLWGLLGFAVGVGLWVFPLIGVYAIPALVYVAWASRPTIVSMRRLLSRGASLGVSGLVGASPWLWYTATHGPTTLTELSGAAIASASPVSPIAAILQRGLSLALFSSTVVFGLRPPWGVQFLALPLAPFALAMGLAVMAFAVRRTWRVRAASRAGRGLLLGVCLTLAAAFVLTPFGNDPSGRYFLPCSVVLALLTAEMLSVIKAQRRWLAQTLALGLVTFQAWGILQSAVTFPPGLTTQFDPVAQVDQRDLPAVMEFLRAHGETHGYTNYWVTFPLAFLSREELIYAARLPYHLDFSYTPRDDRYAPFTQAAQASPRAAYITTRHPELDRYLRESLTALGVSFREQSLGDFHIFYALSRKVTPDELGLGEACCQTQP
jgi:hypothetical protein